MKNKIQKEWKNFKNKVTKIYKDFRKNPKKSCLTFSNTVVETISNNTLFFVFVITNVFIGILLRYFTIHTMENLLLLKPILADIAIVLFLGGFNFFLKEKNRFLYLLINSNMRH